MPSKHCVYRFHVKLLGVEPPITRTIEISEDATCWDLHVAIQDAMGWLDYHMHSFDLDDTSNLEPKRIGIPDGPYDTTWLAGWEVPVSDVFPRPGTNVRYEYDFGDGWLHDITLMAIEVAPRRNKPRCLAGERACPPEDCGGVNGYQRLLEVLADPAHPEYDDMRDWLSNRHAKKYWPYRPDAFSIRSVRFRDADEALGRLLAEW